jgi:hypothetical protein
MAAGFLRPNQFPLEVPQVLSYTILIPRIESAETFGISFPPETPSLLVGEGGGEGDQK